MDLKENERLDDLQYKGLKIIQNTEGFCFGIDSVLLTDFAKKIKPNSIVADLGSGTGILSILLSAKTTNTKFVGVEIQKDVAEMSRRSVEYNKLNDRIKIENCNILGLKEKYNYKSFDAIVTNPPYKKINTGIINENDAKLISRHEITASLEDFIEVSSYLLKDFGEFYMVNRPDRLVDILYLMRKNNIEPKEMRFVHPNIDKPTNLVLIKGVKCGKPFLKIDNNLYIYEKNGEYTKEILEIYNK